MPSFGLGKDGLGTLVFLGVGTLPLSRLEEEGLGFSILLCEQVGALFNLEDNSVFFRKETARSFDPREEALRLSMLFDGEAPTLSGLEEDDRGLSMQLCGETITL